MQFLLYILFIWDIKKTLGKILDKTLGKTLETHCIKLPCTYDGFNLHCSKFSLVKYWKYVYKKGIGWIPIHIPLF